VRDKNAASSGADGLRRHGMALNKGLQDKKRREGFSLRGAPCAKKAQRSCVDRIRRHGMALNKGLKDKKRREGFSLSRAPGRVGSCRAFFV
jgi:hypothetical protein